MFGAFSVNLYLLVAAGAVNVPVSPFEENLEVGSSSDWLRTDQLHVDGCSFKNARKSFYAISVSLDCF